MAGGILIPSPGRETAPLVMKAEILNTRPPENSPGGFKCVSPIHSVLLLQLHSLLPSFFCCVLLSLNIQYLLKLNHTAFFFQTKLFLYAIIAFFSTNLISYESLHLLLTHLGHSITVFHFQSHHSSRNA